MMEASDFRDQDPQRQLADAISDSVMNEDFDFFNAIVQNQDLLTIVEIAEYLNVKRQKAEDPVERNRWEAGLDHHLQSLTGQEFSDDDVKTLTGIIQSMEFDAIINSDEVAEETVVPTEHEDTNAWGVSEFEPQYTNEDLETMRKLPVFAQAEELVQEGQFQTAMRVLSKIGGERGLKARQIIDWYVLKRAQELVQEDQFQTATLLVHNNASGKKSAGNIREVLDKTVFLRATELANEGQLTTAERLIMNNASSKARAEAMLEELGLR
jgi:hypothetical protein